MSIYIASIAAILCGLILAIIKRNTRPSNYPPGPISLPLIGNLIQVGMDAHLSFIELGKKYGDIFSIDLGSIRCVVINDFRLIRQFLALSEFSGRPKIRIFLERSGGPTATFARGIMSSEGPHWSEQRRFALKNLKDFGFGKTCMEFVIHEEITELLNFLAVDAGKLISTKGRFNSAVLNTLLRIMTGNRIRQTDPQFQIILRAVSAGFSNGIFPYLFFPTLTKWFPKLTGYADFIGITKPVDDFIHEVLRDHRKTIIPGHPSDLADALLDEVASTTDPKSTFYDKEGEINIVKTLADLFVAGAESTSTLLEWMCLLLALNPECQEKMYDEIQSVVDKSSLPRLSDRPHMFYTECVLMESLRFTSIVPFAIPHNMMEDADIAGYFIPKNTVILANLFAVHYSKEIWGDPETFRPERFLFSDGIPNQSHEAFMPFSTGKRACIGEKLAKDEHFLFTTSLIQKFRISTNSKGPLPTTKAITGITLTPAPHLLMFQKRFQ